MCETLKLPGLTFPTAQTPAGHLITSNVEEFTLCADRGSDNCSDVMSKIMSIFPSAQNPLTWPQLTIGGFEIQLNSFDSPFNILSLEMSQVNLEMNPL